ncbi:MAG: hypothetical protein R3C10_03545 [Pirellulales bacterium]
MPVAIVAEGQVTASGATLSGPWFADGEGLAFDSVSMPCHFHADQSGVRIDNLRIECDDIVRLAASGAMMRIAGVWEPVAGAPLECTTNVNLAALVNMIPHRGALRHADAVRGTCRSRPAAAAMPRVRLLSADVTTGDIVAVTSAGQSISWPQPVSLSLVARQSEVADVGGVSDLANVVFESIELRSDFAQVDARGTPSSMNADASVDLALLEQHLGQFVDMSGTAMTGRVAAHLEWLFANDEATASVEADVDNLELAAGWSGPAGRTGAQPACRPQRHSPGRALQAVSTASLQMTAGQDNLTVTLTEPVEIAAQRWPVQIDSAGDIRRWLTRGQPWLGSELASELSGNFALAAGAVWGADLVTVSAAELQLVNVRGNMLGVALNEPSARLDMAANWDRTRSIIELSNVVLRSPALALSSERLTVAGTSLGTFRGEGQVLFAAELARLSPRWPATRPPRRRFRCGAMRRDAPCNRSWHHRRRAQSRSRAGWTARST